MSKATEENGIKLICDNFFKQFPEGSEEIINIKDKKNNTCKYK